MAEGQRRRGCRFHYIETGGPLSRSPHATHLGNPDRNVRHRPIEHPGWLTGGDFTEADEPLRLFAAWFAEAKRAEPVNPDAMTLATVDADGLPNARMVLLKGFDERGFVFYTNLGSVKGHELADAPKAALTFYWKSLQRQVRLRGTRRAGDGRGSRRLFRHALAHGADRRLGQQAVRARSKAAWRSRRRSRAIRRNSPSARCRGRRTGRAIAWCRRRSSSGRSGRSVCTTASRFGARDPDAPWTKTRLYP